jgi:hypothetical protein
VGLGSVPARVPVTGGATVPLSAAVGLGRVPVMAPVRLGGVAVPVKLAVGPEMVPAIVPEFEAVVLAVLCAAIRVAERAVP